jgi:hypothetical protein
VGVGEVGGVGECTLCIPPRGLSSYVRVARPNVIGAAGASVFCHASTKLLLEWGGGGGRGRDTR